MPYNITIRVRGADVKRISGMVAELVEKATGQRAHVFIHDRSILFGNRQKQFATVQEKLLKNGKK